MYSVVVVIIELQDFFIFIFLKRHSYRDVNVPPPVYGVVMYLLCLFLPPFFFFIWS